MFHSTNKHSLTENAYMLNGIKWLKEHFPLPDKYEYDAIWDALNKCPSFSVLKLNLEHKGNSYIAQPSDVTEPWIDTLFEPGQAKALLHIIEWNMFDQFAIVDKEVKKEILAMDIPLDAYRLCINDYVIEKEKFHDAKSLESYLVLNEHEIIGRFHEVHKAMEEVYGYKYIKTITHNNLIS